MSETLSVDFVIHVCHMASHFNSMGCIMLSSFCISPMGKAW